MPRRWEAWLQQVCATTCITYIHIHDRLGHKDPESRAGGHACLNYTNPTGQSQLLFPVMPRTSPHTFCWASQADGGRQARAAGQGRPLGPRPLQAAGGPEAGARLPLSATGLPPSLWSGWDGHFPWSPAGALGALPTSTWTFHTPGPAPSRTASLPQGHQTPLHASLP